MMHKGWHAIKNQPTNQTASLYQEKENIRHEVKKISIHLIINVSAFFGTGLKNRETWSAILLSMT